MSKAPSKPTPQATVGSAQSSRYSEVKRPPTCAAQLIVYRACKDKGHIRALDMGVPNDFRKAAKDWENFKGVSRCDYHAMRDAICVDTVVDPALGVWFSTSDDCLCRRCGIVQDHKDQVETGCKQISDKTQRPMTDLVTRYHEKIDEAVNVPALEVVGALDNTLNMGNTLDFVKNYDDKWEGVRDAVEEVFKEFCDESEPLRREYGIPS